MSTYRSWQYDHYSTDKSTYLMVAEDFCTVLCVISVVWTYISRFIFLYFVSPVLVYFVNWKCDLWEKYTEIKSVLFVHYSSSVWTAPLLKTNINEACVWCHARSKSAWTTECEKYCALIFGHYISTISKVGGQPNKNILDGDRTWS